MIFLRNSLSINELGRRGGAATVTLWLSVTYKGKTPPPIMNKQGDGASTHQQERILSPVSSPPIAATLNGAYTKAC